MAVTHYNLQDVVSYTNDSITSAYVCILAHDSTPNTEPEVGVDWATYWTLMISGGAGGGGGGSDISSFNQVGVSPWERWYAPYEIVRVGQNFNYSVVPNSLKALPFICPRGGIIDRIGLVGAASYDVGTPQHIRIGLYAATSVTNLYPGVLIVDSGEFTINNGNLKSATINIMLASNTLYWICILGDSVANAPTFNQFNLATVLAFGNRFLGLKSDFTKVGVGCSIAHTYNILPNPFPEGAAVIDIDSSNLLQIPVMAIRYSA